MRKEFDDALKSVENSVQKGRKGDRWYSHKSVEGGRDTLAYGHKLTPLELKTGMIKVGPDVVSLAKGLTDAQAETLFQQDKARHEANIRKVYPEYDTLPNKYKEVLVNVAFNAGTPTPTTWPKLFKSIAKGDDKAVRQEMVTHYNDPKKGWTPLLTRANAIADVAGLDTDDFVGKIYAAAMNPHNYVAAYNKDAKHRRPQSPTASAEARLTPEFVKQYQSLLGNVGTRDPSQIRFHDQSLNLQGYAILPDDGDKEYMESLKRRYEPWGLTVEPDTVNVVGAENWRPELVSHEFRHLQAPGMSEGVNRLADAAVAQTEPQWDEAVRSRADHLDQLPSETLDALYKDLGRDGWADREYDRQYDLGARPEGRTPWYSTDRTELHIERKRNAQWPKQEEAYREYEDWNEGIKRRNKERTKPTVSQIDYQNPKLYGDFKPIELTGNTFAERYKSFREQAGMATLPLEMATPLGTAAAWGDLTTSMERGDTTPWEVAGVIPFGGPMLSKMRGGWKYFDNKYLKMLMHNVQMPESRDALINMSPKDYLRMAEHLPRNDGGGLLDWDESNVQNLVNNWDPNHAEIPYLEVNDTGNVVSHNGRHRAIALDRMGAESIPVRLINYSKSWDNVHTPRTMTEQRDWEHMADYPALYSDLGPAEVMEFPLKPGQHGVATGAKPVSVLDHYRKMQTPEEQYAKGWEGLKGTDAAEKEQLRKDLLGDLYGQPLDDDLEAGIDNLESMEDAADMSYYDKQYAEKVAADKAAREAQIISDYGDFIRQGIEDSRRYMSPRPFASKRTRPVLKQIHLLKANNASDDVYAKYLSNLVGLQPDTVLALLDKKLISQQQIDRAVQLAAERRRSYDFMSRE